jgi:hypothetical protein
MLAYPLKDWKIYVSKTGEVLVELRHATPLEPEFGHEKTQLFHLTPDQARQLAQRLASLAAVAHEFANQPPED